MISSEVYEPAEDSYLIGEIVGRYCRGKKVLDIGTGSGYLSEIALKNNAKEVTATDINPNAVKLAKSKNISAAQSDLFENIHGKFDLIIFNPPYLPEDKYDKGRDTSAGKYGSEIINEFLKQAKNHLTENGKILLLTSSFTKEIKWGNYQKKLIERKKLFFEELYVWELRII